MNDQNKSLDFPEVTSYTDVDKCVVIHYQNGELKTTWPEVRSQIKWTGLNHIIPFREANIDLYTFKRVV